MAAGTSQESRLAIVIDTKGAEARIKRLRDALNGLGGTANNAGAGANAAGAGAQRLSRDASGATTAIQRMTQSMGALSGAFAAFASVSGVISILKTADAMQSLNSKIKLATSSTEEYLAVQGRLRAMAQSNLTEYDSLVDLYASSRRALKQLGKTQNETLAFTDNLTKAMFVGGGAASSQAAALVQLGQALASGVLRGDEFNSIAEQAPILLELVAEKMGVAQGALRKLAADGKISSRVLYDAISDATEKLDEMVGKMPATMTQALQTVKNQYKFFIDDMLNSTGGLSSVIASSLLAVGQNLNSLITVITAAAAAWGAYALATSAAVTTGVVAAINSLTTMGYAFISNTALMKAQILSYFELNAMINRYNLNMMLARLTLASYVDLVKTSIAAVQAKAAVMANAVKSTIATIGADIRHGQILASLAGTARAAAAAITQKVAAMRAGITTASVYAASLRVVAGTAAVTATAIKGLGAAFASLGAIIKAHPIMIIGSVLLAFVAASKNAEGKILGLSGAFSSLGDAVKVLGYVLVDIIGGIKDVASTFGRFIVSMISNSEKGANESSAMFQIFFANTEGGFVGMLQVMARFADLAGATMKTLVEAIGRGFGNMLTDVSNKFASLGNSIIEIMNKVTTAITGVVNGGLDLISGMVSIANKIPFVNIADDKRRSVAKTIETRFNDNKKLDTRGFSYELGKNYGSFSNDGMASRLQGHIDSMKGAKLEAKANLDLADAITATGDESDKAKEKKVKNAKKSKEAVDKEAEAYARLMESYAQQMAAFKREAYDLSTPFATELSKIAYEVDNVNGKFYGLAETLKSDLRNAASYLDTLKIGDIYRTTILSMERELSLLDNDSMFSQWAYDLMDANNILSTMDETLKGSILESVAKLESARASSTINNSIKESIEGINREIGLMSTSGSALDEFIYDLNNTEKYANASGDAINNLGDALTKLDNLKKGDALSAVMDEIAQESPLGKIEADYQRRLEIIDDYESQWTDLVGVHSAERTAIEQSYMDAKRDLMLTQGEALFGDLAGLAKGFAGEQSGIYKALFLVEKGFAIAQSAIAIQTSIAKAMSVGFPANIPIIGQAVSQGMGIMSSIKGITAGFKQGGYTGNMGASQVAGVVHGQEYVFDAAATKRIGVDNLNAMRRGDKVGGGDVNITVNNMSSARVETQKDDNGNIIMTIREEVKKSWGSLSNPNSFESKQVNRNVQAPRRR